MPTAWDVRIWWNYLAECNFCRIFAAKISAMQQQLRINPAQYELLNLLSCVDKQEDVVELKNVIVQFLNSRLQREINKLWDNGTLTEEKTSEWKDEHMRTPYKWQLWVGWGSLCLTLYSSAIPYLPWLRASRGDFYGIIWRLGLFFVLLQSRLCGSMATSRFLGKENNSNTVLLY